MGDLEGGREGGRNGGATSPALAEESSWGRPLSLSPGPVGSIIRTLC